MSRRSNRKTRLKRRGSAALVAVVGLAGLAAGAASAAILLTQPVPAQLGVSSDVSPPVTVVRQVFDGARAAQAFPELADEAVLAIHGGGRVTGTYCEPGKELSSGDRILELDGRPVVLLATAVPQWRDLAIGAVGEDVRSLQTELQRLGYDVPIDGQFRPMTRMAVRALLGEPALGPGVLPVDQVVWYNEQLVVPTDCRMAVGDIVQAGQEIMSVGGGLIALQVQNPPQEPGWIAEYNGLTAPIGESGVITDPTFLAAVAEGPELAFALEQGGGIGVELPIRLSSPVEVAAVPPSAILVTSEGNGCVMTDHGTEPVRIVASSLGQAMVHFDQFPNTVNSQFPDNAFC